MNTEEAKEILQEEVDYKTLYLQALADYANLKRNNEKTNKLNVKRVISKMICDFLPVYTDAKRGLQYGETGCQLIFNKLVNIINSYGISIINLEYIKNRDSAFSIDYAEAIGVEPTEDPTLDNKIFDVIEDGFINENDEVIIPAKVIVFKYS